MQKPKLKKKDFKHFKRTGKEFVLECSILSRQIRITESKSLTTLTTLFYFAITIKMKSLAMLTALFYFTTIKMKSLATLTTLFKFTTIKMKSLSTLTFTSPLLK